MLSASGTTVTSLIISVAFSASCVVEPACTPIVLPLRSRNHFILLSLRMTKIRSSFTYDSDKLIDFAASETTDMLPMQSIVPSRNSFSLLPHSIGRTTSSIPSLSLTSRISSMSKPTISPLSLTKLMGGNALSTPRTICPASSTLCSETSLSWTLSRKPPPK